jgi:hypothetical protein
LPARQASHVWRPEHSTGGKSGDCQPQANNDLLSVQAFNAAQEQVKSCNKLADAQAKADARQQTQEAKMDKNDAVKALGDLFK